MASVWFYVEGQDRVGPLQEEEMAKLFQEGTLDQERFVWRKGFEQWKRVSEVPELLSYLQGSQASEPDIDFPEQIAPLQKFSWDHLDEKQPLFSIKIGPDRGLETESEYGPYSLEVIKKMFDQNRINSKTYLFAPGMEDWTLLAEIPIYEELFNELPPEMNEQERRNSQRRPFVARMFFHNDRQVYEGVCRDISSGGMQVLVAQYPGKVGDSIALNVHPDNSNYHFTASGKIVRLLDGQQGFSFRFTDLNDEALSAINNYLNK